MKPNCRWVSAAVIGFNHKLGAAVERKLLGATVDELEHMILGEYRNDPPMVVSRDFMKRRKLDCDYDREDPLCEFDDFVMLKGYNSVIGEKVWICAVVVPPDDL